jgi:hypothetical protein
VTKDRRDQLIAKGRSGILDPSEIKELVEELETYRVMAIKMADDYLRLVKEAEGWE